MAGSTSFPGGVDNFAEASPARMSDTDATGRDHEERHDDVEAAVEAVETWARASAGLQSSSPTYRPPTGTGQRVQFFTTTEPTAAVAGDVWWDISGVSL